jgi:hypothetical protein
MNEKMQPDFESIPHKLENNKFSQAHLDENRHKYRGQAALVFSLLMKGVYLDSDTAKEQYGIHHLARRIGDLGDCKKLQLVEGFEQPSTINSSAFKLAYSTSEFGIYIDREDGLRNGKKTGLTVYFLPGYRKAFIEKGWIVNKKYPHWYSEKYTHPKIIAQIKALNK